MDLWAEKNVVNGPLACREAGRWTFRMLGGGAVALYRCWNRRHYPFGMKGGLSTALLAGNSGT